MYCIQGRTALARAAGTVFSVAALTLMFLPTSVNARRGPGAVKPGDIPSTSKMPSIVGGKERWDVKTGQDAGAASIDLSKPVKTTVTDLVHLPRPANLHAADSRLGPKDPLNSKRANDTEKTAFVVDAEITDYKIEYDLGAVKQNKPPGDSDCHIVIREPGKKDAGGKDITMVAEIPHPLAIKGKSPWSQMIADVRLKFEQRCHPTFSFTHPAQPIKVRITGIGFYDFVHDKATAKRPAAPRGVAETNAIEIHPVLKMEFAAPAGSDAAKPAGHKKKPKNN